MKIQLDIPKELNQRLKIYRIKNNFVSMKIALVDILYKFFKQSKDEGGD